MSGYSGSFMEDYTNELINKLLDFKIKIKDPELKKEFNEIIGIDKDKYYGIYIESCGMICMTTGEELFYCLYRDCHLDDDKTFIITLSKKEYEMEIDEIEEKELKNLLKRKIPLREIFI